MNRFNRPVTGLVLLFTAIFIVNARRCGLLGLWLAKGISMLLGTFGGFLLVFALVTCGLVMIVPWRLVAKAMKAQRRRPVIHPAIHYRPVRRAVVASPPLHSASRQDERNWSLTFAPLEPPKPANETLSPSHRMRLDDVRSALKGLGYRPNEYEQLVKEMDPSQPFERLVKDGLHALRRN